MFPQVTIIILSVWAVHDGTGATEAGAAYLFEDETRQEPTDYCGRCARGCVSLDAQRPDYSSNFVGFRALVDAYHLTHGFWEAKNSQDDFQVNGENRPPRVGGWNFLRHLWRTHVSASFKQWLETMREEE